MATSKEYTVSRKISDTEEEIIQLPYSVLADAPNLATVATSGSYNDLSDKPTIPSAVTSIDGLSGGTLTSPITLTGGDSATASKMILDANGQITDTGTATLFGRSGGNLIVGSSSYPTTLRGKQTRPTYNGNDMALKSDVPTKTSELTNDNGYTTNKGTVTQVKIGDETKSPDDNGLVDLGVITANKVAHPLFIESNGNTDSTKRYDGQSSIALNFSSDYFRSVPASGTDPDTGEKYSGISVQPRPTGVTAGTYNKVTVDDRGRVIAGESASEQFQKFVYTFRGDGTTTSFDIIHPLGTDVVVQVYLMKQTVGSDTVDELVIVGTYTMYGKVKLVFAAPPATTQSFKVVIIGTKTNLGTLDETDWSTIRSVIMSGNVANYWSVGDIKTITSKSGKEYSIRLADIQNGRYDYSDGSGSSKAVFEFVKCYDLNGTLKWAMNSSNTNVGGWAQSLIKTSAIPTILADLPDDMVSVMSEVKVLSGTGGGTASGTSSSDNKLFLAAESELVSSPSLSIGVAESPLGAFDYYKMHTDALSKIKAVVGTGNEIDWWLRSPRRVNSSQFCYITARGVLSYYNASSTYGISPIFVI